MIPIFVRNGIQIFEYSFNINKVFVNKHPLEKSEDAASSGLHFRTLAPTYKKVECHFSMPLKSKETGSKYYYNNKIVHFEDKVK